MLRRLLLTTLLCMTAGGAAATDYTDIWYDPPESGWGVNIVQSDTFLFMTFFLYGSDGRPTWYVAQVTQDASGNFNGTLYQATGTYFALPWAGNVVSVAGTASFQPITPYSANLVYTVNNVGTVSKPIQRQPLTVITIGGGYTGGLSLAQTGCVASGGGTLSVNIQVTQPVDPTAPVTVAMNRADGLTCSLTGPLKYWGKLYQMQNASYTCTNGRSTTANVDELTATAHGIEGTWSALVEGGCVETGIFSAVLR